MASVSASAPLPERPAGHREKDRSPAAVPPQQPYAAIDLGTNNCRLLIARPSRGGFTVIDAFSRIVRLGEGLATRGRLTQEAMDRSVEALAVCADKLRRRRVGLARSVATEACRRAANGRHFIERVRTETGIALEIIAPQEEARLAVLGCHKLLEPGDGPAIIFDIGGGSTELVLVEPGGEDTQPRIKAWWSAPWGVVSLTESEGRARSRGDRVAAYGRMRTRAVTRSPGSPSSCRSHRQHPPARHQRDGDDPRLGPSALPSYDRRAVTACTCRSRPCANDAASRKWLQGRSRCLHRLERADLVSPAARSGASSTSGRSHLGIADRASPQGILRSS
jgi:exopolyphosphatase/guanosine-5'-triphosphate,3'-diphosphate pyrophosphatase